MEKAFFKGIQKEIISELEEAQSIIQVAVAWFTSPELFEVICEKLKAQIKVEIIIIDDYINNGDYRLNFQHFIELGGKLRYGDPKHPMHNKFCIIDKKILITGSYNWTYYAENRNVENIIIRKENQELVNQYVQEFERLKTVLKISPKAILRNISKIREIDYFAIKEYLGYDLYYKGKLHSNIKFIEAASRLLPQNNLILQEYKSLSSKKIIKKTTTDLGVEAILDGLGERFSRLINKGTIVPCTKKNTYYTSVDYQTELHVKVFKGTNDLITKNDLIGTTKVKGLPAKPVRGASVTVTFHLSEDGKLTVTSKNNQTNSEMIAFYNVGDLVF